MSQRKTISIDGMHCRSCELLVEKNLASVPGVAKARVSHKTGKAQIEFEGTPPHEGLISKAVEDAGYRIGTGSSRRPWLSRESSDWYELAIAVLSAFILYVALDLAGAFDLAFDFGAAPALPVVILVGLAAGISTCMAVVGGLVLSLSARYAEMHPEASRLEKVRPSFYFNIGRVVSFAFLGGLIGGLGAALNPSGSLIGAFILAAGVVMIWLGLKLLGVSPKLENAGISLPSSMGRMLGLNKESKQYTDLGAFVTGAVTFFLPCGFTQAMQIYAISTGSFVQGAAIMSLFALGTMPGFLGAGALASFFRGPRGRLFFKFIGVVVIAFGAFNAKNGMTLAGWELPSGGSEPAKVAEVEVAEGVQVVRMAQVSNGYRPNRFTVKKGVPVRWVIDSQNPYTCAAYLVVPKLNVSKFLERGENVITFTPTEAGRIPFSCSMGMYGGSFTVVD